MAKGVAVLSEVTAEYYDILNDPDGGQAMADKYLSKTQFKSRKRFDEAIKKQSTGEKADGFWSEVAKDAGNVVEQFTSAVTMGQSVYLQAGIDMLADNWDKGTTGEKPTSYSESLTRARKRDQEFRKENQGASILIDVAGGSLPGIGLANLATKAGSMAVKAGQPIRNILSQAKVEVPAGAVEEVSRGMASGAETGDVIERGIWGGGIGGFGSLISGVVESASKPVIDFLDDTVTPWVKRNILGTTPAPKTPKLTRTEEVVADDLNRSLKDEGLTRQDLMDEADVIDELGMGDKVRVATIAGPETQSTVKNLGVSPGGTKTKIQKELVDDLEASSDDVANVIRKDMGFNDEGDKAIKLGIENRARGKAKPLYDIAYQLPNINNVEIDTIIRQVNDATKGDFYDEVIKLSKLRNAHIKEGQIPLPEYTPESMPYGDIPVRVIDIFQRAVRDLAKKAKGEEAKELWRLRKVLLDLTEKDTKVSFTQLLKEGYTPGQGVTNSRLLKQFPQLKEMPDDKIDEFFQTLDAGDGTYFSPFSLARKEWGGTLSNIDAYEKGTSALKSSKRASVVKEEWDELASQAERDNYRLAAATHAIEGIEESAAETKNFAKAFLSEGSRKKFMIMFENDPVKLEAFIKRIELQNQIHKAATGMMPRSDTAGNMLNFFSHMREWMSTSSVENKMLQAGGRVVQKTLNEEVLQQQNKAIADALTKPGTSNIRKQASKAAQRESDLTRRAMNQARIGGGISTGGPAGLLTPRGEEAERQQGIL